MKVVIGNGIVTVTFANPEGYILGISYAGIDAFNPNHKRTDRGYFDVVWNEPGKPGIFQRIEGTKFSIIEQDENKVEVSFSRTWTTSLRGSNVPMSIDKRYILRKGDSGFYSYVIFDRPEGLPAVEVYQIRFVYKLHERFNYMAISDTRQRNMPSEREREMGTKLDYPEAVRITNASNPEFIGEVDDKYQYSCENQDNILQGWITHDSKQSVGIWMITPSNEFRNGGPVHQDLTSHVGPILLNMFVSTHYAGKSLGMTFQQGETHKKVYGPFFTYLNSAESNAKYKTLWSDAVQQKTKEVQSWPYDFTKSKDFFPAKQRGRVEGVLNIQDRFITEGRAQPAKNAYVGLAVPGNAGSWQQESKGYQFWTRTDGNGHFEIKNIVPGEYNLYAWVPGFIGDYKYEKTITITPGRDLNLDSLLYSPPRNGPTLWEIGTPDRSAAEFYVPDPYPNLLNNLYKNDTKDKFREYGLWARYSEIYPQNDLVFTVGVSDYKKDWFYAHVTRKVENTYQPTIWQIVFQLQDSVSNGDYTLHLALASANGAEVQVRLNDPNAGSPIFTTGLIGGDNAIARHGIHGLYWLFSIPIPSSHLVKGNNTIYLRQATGRSPFAGVMYDYIRLEGPATQGV
ncbi:hypothetical protein TanjilG_25533 [Lupinus angustifolius]|uniref:rhamnogalacturonan endolyase n=1 Tax=Lupinus angustifolius TaxID=3871 RepID=A0A4P1QTF5_LUPAN|nr:hypothetical protein TanjilG_25533 [Lupinus angustifolius]